MILFIPDTDRVITFHPAINPSAGRRANGVLMEQAETPSKTSHDRKMSFDISHNNTKDIDEISCRAQFYNTNSHRKLQAVAVLLYKVKNPPC